MKKIVFCLIAIIVLTTITFESICQSQMTLKVGIKNGAKIGLAGSGTVIIDWGDGKSDTSMLSNSQTEHNHIYKHRSFFAVYNITIIGENVTELNLSWCNMLIDGEYDMMSCKELDVSKNVALTHLICGNNCFLHLDISKNVALIHLDCNDNCLSDLDISKNTMLQYLRCKNNQLIYLDVSNQQALRYLVCDNNPLINLDISKNLNLEHLSCINNELKDLDVSKNVMLNYLSCETNELTDLDISKNITLEYLNCSDNKLNNLNISKNTALKTLHCGYNLLRDLDASRNEKLFWLTCNKNNLSEKALNTLFTMLNDTAISKNKKIISIIENPGADSCDKSIAEKKGWRFITR